jgi:hypothetical protein
MWKDDSIPKTWVDVKDNAGTPATNPSDELRGDIDAKFSPWVKMF